MRLGVGVLLVLYAIYSLARPAIKPMKIGAPADVGIGIVNGLVGGLAGLGGVVSTSPANGADGRGTSNAPCFNRCCLPHSW